VNGDVYVTLFPSITKNEIFPKSENIFSYSSPSSPSGGAAKYILPPIKYVVRIEVIYPTLSHIIDSNSFL